MTPIFFGRCFNTVLIWKNFFISRRISCNASFPLLTLLPFIFLAGLVDHPHFFLQKWFKPGVLYYYNGRVAFFFYSVSPFSSDSCLSRKCQKIPRIPQILENPANPANSRKSRESRKFSKIPQIRKMPQILKMPEIREITVFFLYFYKNLTFFVLSPHLALNSRNYSQVTLPFHPRNLRLGILPCFYRTKICKIPAFFFYSFLFLSKSIFSSLPSLVCNLAFWQTTFRLHGNWSREKT